MPRPVEALPCGSRSTISTFSPIAARAVPRLIAVVVLPTPPFWFARARTRGTRCRSVMAALSGAAYSVFSMNYKVLALDRTPNNNDPRLRIGDAGDKLSLDCPRFRGGGQ